MPHATDHLPLRIRGALPPLSHTFSWRADQISKGDGGTSSTHGRDENAYKIVVRKSEEGGRLGEQDIDGEVLKWIN